MKPTGHRLREEPGFPPYPRLSASGAGGARSPGPARALLFAPKPAPLSRMWIPVWGLLNFRFGQCISGVGLWLGAGGLGLVGDDYLGAFFGGCVEGGHFLLVADVDAAV
ncbi:hypothetical protein Stsp01_31180 [Streptomyces sp. NBRC 13847]|nr:hypothetical protein Stsp01_31180 [Streptomyces sp. NBRC 13847]